MANSRAYARDIHTYYIDFMFLVLSLLPLTIKHLNISQFFVSVSSLGSPKKQSDINQATSESAEG
jgi:hypothetical protein